MLTNFLISSNSDFNSDSLEKIGNVLLKPLRLVCGRVVKIDYDLKTIELPAASKTKRLAVAIFSSIFFIITLPALIIGVVCIWNSKTYKKFKELEVSNLKTSDNETQQINLKAKIPDSKDRDQALLIFQEDEACIFNQVLNEETEPEAGMPKSPDCIQQQIQNLATCLTPTTEPPSAEKESSKSDEMEVDDFKPIIQDLPNQDHLTKISVSIENSNNKQINENLEKTLSRYKHIDSMQIPKLAQYKSMSNFLDSRSKFLPSSKKAYIVATLALLSIPLVYHAYTDIDYNPIIDKMNQLFAIATNKETFNTLIGPFAEEVGLPFIRSGCYVTAMFLGTQKVAQAIAFLGLKLIPGARSLENKINEAFKRHLIRDVCLIIGLLGTGFLVEELESDLNIYLQQLEINERPLTHLLNGNFKKFLIGIRKELFDSDKPVVNLVNDTQNTYSEIFYYSKNYLNKLEPIAKTAIYSMKRMRLTPLKSHSILELKFGLPLRRFGITETHEFSAVTNFFYQINLSKMTTDIKNCLTTECLNEKKNLVLRTLNSAYEAPVKFMKSQFENTKLIAADYISEMINRTLAFQSYVNINNTKNYASSLFIQKNS